VHFAEVAVQQEGEAKDEGEESDMEAAISMLESCQKVLEGVQEFKAKEEQQEQQEDFEVIWGPAWSDEHKARVKASWATEPDELWIPGTPRRW
jgi:hypothetical protein